MIDKVLEKYGNIYVKEIRNNLSETGTNATGKTSDSVQYNVYHEGNNIILEVTGGRQFFPTVETGSKPSTKNPSPAMIESLTDWAKSKGIETKAVYGIAKTILKDGSKLWQKGGRKDIYSNIKIDALIDEITKDQKAQILNTFKNGR